MKSVKKSPPRKTTPPPRPPPPDAARLKLRPSASASDGADGALKNRATQTGPVIGKQAAPGHGKLKPLIPVRPAPAPPTPVPMTQPDYNKTSPASTSSNRSNAFTRSAPTLGTITDSPDAVQPHVSLFLQASPTGGTAATTSPATTSASASPGGPASSASRSTVISSIDTGATPLSTTPGGTVTPIKLTMSGLKAAAAAQEANQNQSPLYLAHLQQRLLQPQPQQQQLQLQVPHSPEVAAAPTAAPAAVTAAPEPSKRLPAQMSDTQPAVVVESRHPGQQQPSFEAPPRSPGDQSQNNSNRTAFNPNQSESGNWAIYLFLGIFLLVLLVLIITLVITKQRK